ncbi:MAG: GDSL family lipase [Thermoguttaceae bacterium]|nr:GDSL family lipase [Thermoguttaceae bacterium]
MTKSLNLAAFVVGVLGLTFAFVGAPSLALAQPAVTENLAVTLENRDIGRFKQQAERMAQGNVDLLWIGDSITHGWEGAGKDVWEKYYGDMKAINLGIGGDQTQHVLWRIENYDWSKVNPKLAVLLIGVNNTWSRDRQPADIALGNRRIVTKLHSLFPEMKIIVLKIFPCTSRPDQQAEIDKINALMPYAVRDLDYVELIDIGKVFLNEDGVLTKDVMPDLLHPNAVGYESWGAALDATIKAKLGK